MAERTPTAIQTEIRTAFRKAEVLGDKALEAERAGDGDLAARYDDARWPRASASPGSRPSTRS